MCSTSFNRGKNHLGEDEMNKKPFMIVVSIILLSIFSGYSTNIIILQNGHNDYNGCIDNWAQVKETEVIFSNAPNTFTYDSTIGGTGEGVLTAKNVKLRVS